MRHLFWLVFLLGCEEPTLTVQDCSPVEITRVDADGDGYLEADDCDDTRADVNPATVEICNGIDDDCDGAVDEGSADHDEDGIPDCLDIEECDGLDNDGDGEIDEGSPDSDGDGLPDCLELEDCDGLDNDGDGEIDEDYSDGDGDGIADCIDDEECDGDDDNGNGIPDDGFEDSDLDGTADCVDPCTDLDGDGFGDPGFDASTCATDLCPDTPDPLQLDHDGDGLGDACDDDDDDDGVLDDDDNCVFTENPDQVDSDGDGEGDLCDEDSDGDGVDDGDDNCVLIPNSDQADNDDDGAGDVCDDDDDDDGVLDVDDNCVFDANTSQADNDSDGDGDVCDDDDDDDGVLDLLDNCVFVANDGQEDNESDGRGDACDPDDDNDGVLDVDDNCVFDRNADQLDHEDDDQGDVCDDDDDNDGVLDDDDNCVFVANPNQEDNEPDGIGDACDDDDDNDSVLDSVDNCPTVANSDQRNSDTDTFGDACDDDDDGDLVADTLDNCPTTPNPVQRDNDQDGIGDLCDDDDDNDGVVDLLDNCDFDANPDQENNDGDGPGDACDDDDDNDGDIDLLDNCPLTPNPRQDDEDLDGLGDACDDDDDQDGVLDEDDNCVLAANPGQEDFDGDGAGDACDDDDDGDGIVDSIDNCDFAVNPDQENNDGDAVGDICDDDDDNDSVLDGADNCVFDFNSNQRDTDGDGDGDACDDDDDDDGTVDDLDCRPLDDEVFPGAADTCDGVDSDCDGAIDDGDFDGSLLPAGTTQVRLLTVRNRGTTDERGRVVPVSMTSSDGVSLSGIDTGGSNVRITNLAGQLLPFYVESVNPTAGEMLAWVRLDLDASASVQLVMSWGFTGLPPAADPDATFDLWIDGDTVPTGSGLMSYGDVRSCLATVPNDVSTSATSGELSIFRPNQGAFWWVPDSTFCPSDTEGLTLRARARNATSHFDRDLRVGFVWTEPGWDFVGEERPATSSIGLIDEVSQESFRYVQSCAHVYGEAAENTTATANTTQLYQVQLHDETVLGQVAGGDVYSHALPSALTDSWCAVPGLRGNTDSGDVTIDIRVDWLEAHHELAVAPALEICSGGADLVLSAPRDLDGDGQDDSADDDADGDGQADAADCAPYDDSRHTGANEQCNELDDDCDGEVDEDCELLVDFSRVGQFDSQLQLRAVSPTSSCSAPSVVGGALTWSCPNNHGQLAFLPLPYFDGTHDLRIEVDVGTGAWTDSGPRFGVEVFDGWDGDASFAVTFAGTEGWAFHVADPVDAVQAGCASETCPSIVSNNPDEQLAIGGAVTAAFVDYHLTIELTAGEVSFEVVRLADGAVQADISAVDGAPKIGLIGLLCAETVCTWDNLEISTF